MIGSRQLERVLGESERQGAKVVLVGDPEQLQAIEAGAAFRSIAERHRHVEITEIRRQRERWQQKATRELSTGRAGEALDAYRHPPQPPPREKTRAPRGGGGGGKKNPPGGADPGPRRRGARRLPPPWHG